MGGIHDRTLLLVRGELISGRLHRLDILLHLGLGENNNLLSVLYHLPLLLELTERQELLLLIIWLGGWLLLRLALGLLLLGWDLGGNSLDNSESLRRGTREWVS